MASKTAVDVRGYLIEEGQTVAVGKSINAGGSCQVEVREIAKVVDGRVFLVGRNGTGAYPIMYPKRIAILD